MPSSHLILCRPLLLLRPIPPSIRVFSNEPKREKELESLFKEIMAENFPTMERNLNPGIEPALEALEAQSLNRWTARKVPYELFWSLLLHEEI